MLITVSSLPPLSLPGPGPGWARLRGKELQGCTLYVFVTGPHTPLLFVLAPPASLRGVRGGPLTLRQVSGLVATMLVCCRIQYGFCFETFGSSESCYTVALILPGKIIVCNAHPSPPASFRGVGWGRSPTSELMVKRLTINSEGGSSSRTEAVRARERREREARERQQVTSPRRGGGACSRGRKRCASPAPAPEPYTLHPAP